MNIDKGWFVLFAVAAGVVAGVTLGTGLRHSKQGAIRKREHSRDLKAWENEGGNLAPPPRPATAA
jgi:hypothetical protein